MPGLEKILLSWLAWALMYLACLWIVPCIRMFLRITGMTILAAALGLMHLAQGNLFSADTMLELTLVLAVQAVCGLLIGAPVAFALESLAVCGRLLDLGRGENIGGQMNPALGSQTSAQEQLYRLLSACLIFSGGAYQALLSAASGLKLGELPAEGLDWSHAVKLLSTLYEALILGLVLACPVLLASLVFDICAGLISRVLGRVNIVFEFLPLKLVFGLLISSLVIWTAFERPQLFFGPNAIAWAGEG
ncbi:MAG: flagellar biosynthetic protein FliR [Bdellovibrionales bacterium]|nr:flagellar biosynthetic protein FliR [Bdellovibrionales bacterium]